MWWAVSKLPPPNTTSDHGLIICSSVTTSFAFCYFAGETLQPELLFRATVNDSTRGRNQTRWIVLSIL